jgi:hypothetical protein
MKAFKTCLLSSLILELAQGWVAINRRQPLVVFSSTDDDDSSSISETTRRQWLRNAAGIVGAGYVYPVLPANAADVVKTAAVCDPSVSVFKRNGRVVYLLGTAHISSSSAQLAGRLVQDTQPKGVFVELDPKRVKGSGILAKRVTMDEENGQEVVGPISRVIVPDIQALSTSESLEQPASMDTGGTSTVAALPKPAAKPNVMVRAAGAAVGNSIKGMYKKLDSAGFNAGEEFVIAIREGQKIGYVININCMQMIYVFAYTLYQI